MRCVRQYDPWVSVLFWVCTYLLSISVAVVGAIVVYDLIVKEFSLVSSIVLLILLAALLSIVWGAWRRGLFLAADFGRWVRGAGGKWENKEGVFRGDFERFFVVARFGNYLRGGAPFPSWHKKPIDRQPCGDPECMLCDSKFIFTKKKDEKGRWSGGVDLVVVVGGCWEGLAMVKKLDQALEVVQRRSSEFG